MAANRPTLDMPALQRAVEAERVRRGVTWAALAHEVHVSVPTIQQLHQRGKVEADAVVLLLQWIARHCEDFVIRPATGGSPPPAVPVPPLYGRFDTIALHAALDRKREAESLTWDEIASELGVSKGVIARFSKGGRTNAALMVAAADWAGLPVEALLQPSRPTLGPARMDARTRDRG